MNNSKLISILVKLSGKELSAFGDFVHSPFFNKHKDVIKLTDLIINAAPTFSGKNLQRERVFKKIWPKEQYDYMKLAHVMNYTLNLAEQFLTWQETMAEKTSNDISLARAFLKKEMEIPLSRQLEKINKYIQEVHLKDAEGYFLRYKYAALEDDYFLKKQKRAAGDNIQQKSDFLDRYFLTEKLRIYAEMAGRENVLNVKYRYYLRDEIMEHYQNNKSLYVDDPAIEIYLQMYTLFSKEPDQAFFHQLLTLIDEKGIYFSKKEQSTFYDFVQNYCIKKINSGQPAYLREIFKIYQLLIKNELLPEEQNIPAPLFKNITTVGLRLKELDWTEQFVKNYHIYLPDHIRKDVYNFNLATIFYSKGEYDQALELLRDVEFSDVYYALGAKSLLLKIYFERDEDELLIYTIDAFKIYLKRSKLVSKYQYQVHFNLLRYVKKIHLLRSQIGYKKEAASKLQQIIEEINNTQEITNKEWLLQQLNS